MKTVVVAAPAVAMDAVHAQEELELERIVDDAVVRRVQIYNSSVNNNNGGSGYDDDEVDETDI